MINKNNFDKTVSKYNEFWNLANEDRPILYVTAPKIVPFKSQVKKPDTIEQCWQDVDYLLKSTREKMNNTYFGGESYPYVMPNLGPDIFSTLLGCDISFGESTSWAVHFVKDFNDYKEFTFDEKAPLWKKIIEITEAFVEDAKNGDYYVGVTDMHPGLDALVALRGPDNLCMDLYDYPEEITRRLNSIFPIYERSMDLLFNLVGKYQKYNTHWMSALHDKRWYNISCDFMGIISGAMFDEFVYPEIIKELSLFDKTLFHVDGKAALNHIDKLLEIKELTGIQWVYGAGSPTAKHWIPLLKKIQSANKCIHIDVMPDDIDTILEELSPKGLMICSYCDNEEEAKAIEKKVYNFHKKTLY